MRYVALILLCFSAAAYATVDVRDGKITANLNGEPLDSVIDSIRQQTQIRFSVQEGMGAQTISANFENLPVAIAFKKMLEGTGINFVVLGDNDGQPESIFIGASEKPGASPRRTDNRPVQNRGVVTPVTPMVPPEPVPPPPQEESRSQEKKQPATSVNVPTGGGFVPQSDKRQDQDNNEQQQPVPETPPEEQAPEEQ